MKRTKHIMAGFMVLAILCSACSAGSLGETPEAIIEDTGAGSVVPLAQQTGDSQFTDVPAEKWYAEAIAWCAANDIMSGSTATAFAPEDNTMRVTVAEALYRAEGQPAVSGGAVFSDVEADGSFAPAAAWISANGIMGGYGNGLFGADDPVTREDLATILWRYAGQPAADTGENFADESDISPYASDAVDWARVNGIVNGKPGNLFDPKGLNTRAEVAAILYRYLERRGQRLWGLGGIYDYGYLI